MKVDCCNFFIMTELYAKYTNIVHYLYKVEVVELF